MPKSRSVWRQLALITLIIFILNIGRDATAFETVGRFRDPTGLALPLHVTLSAPRTTTSWDQRDPELQRFELPLLFLHHERDATPKVERTLEVTFSGLSHATQIQLKLVSHHVNVATGEPHVETKDLALPDRPCTADSPCTIHWTLDAATPSDVYYLRVNDGSGNTLWQNPDPHRPAFVALDTWDVSLGEYTARVIYATLFPFSKGQNDWENRLSPVGVTHFIEGAFIPIIKDTWHTQVEEWGFGDAIHPHWDRDNLIEVFITAPPFALFDGTGTYSQSVAADDGLYPERRIWWFSANDSFQAYDSLANAYRAVFAHEFFHLMQLNVLLFTGSPTHRWRNLFVEAQAKVAASVQYPQIELSRDHLVEYQSEYSGAANHFLTDRLNASYRDLETADSDKYDLALYWRFLYEQYNDMSILRAALEKMALHYSPDVVGSLGYAMDAAFESFDGPFHTFNQSLVAFARANYALRLENGRCLAAELADCGRLYYDPQHVYLAPALEAELKFDGERLFDVQSGYSLSVEGMGCAGDPTACGGPDHSASVRSASAASDVELNDADAQLTYTGAIPASYGMDFIEVYLDQTVQGQPLRIDFKPLGTSARFNIQIWALGPGDSQGTKPRLLAPQPETLAASTVLSAPVVAGVGGRLPAAANRLALIITRLDSDETTDPIGSYTITLDAAADAEAESAS